MTVYRGINRDAIEEHSIALVRKITGLPADRVFMARDQANEPAPNRPFCSLFIRVPVGEYRAGQVDHTGLLEYWRFQVDGDDDGDYTATVSGVDHTYTASGETATEIRDGLVAALAASLTSTTVAAGQISGDIESDTPRQRLQVEVSAPNDNLSLAKLRGNIAEVTRQEKEPELEIFCWGLFQETDPSFEDYGETTAERLGDAFMSPAENEALRLSGHGPRTVRWREQDRILDGEVETIGVLTVRLGATSCHVADLQDATEVGWNCQLAQ